MEDIKEKAYAALDAAGIKYELKEHEAAFTIEEIDAMGIDEKGEIAKNLFLRNDNGKQHYLVMTRKDKTSDMKKIRAEIGSSRLSFASEDRLMRVMGLKKGSVSPLGVINDEDRHVKVYIDKDLMDMERVGVHPNENTATVFMAPGELVRFIKEHGNEVALIEI